MTRNLQLSWTLSSRQPTARAERHLTMTWSLAAEPELQALPDWRFDHAPSGAQIAANDLVRGPTKKHAAHGISRRGDLAMVGALFLGAIAALRP
jgi:hypothetical protein